MIVKAYVDGSYDKERGVYGSGIVFLDEKETKVLREIYFGGNDPLWASAWNVAGELQAVLHAAGVAANTEDVTKLIVYHDYEGSAKFATGEWGKDPRKLKPVSRAYQTVIRQLMEKITIEFIWTKGHSGNKWNDLADFLAKRGVQSVNV